MASANTDTNYETSSTLSNGSNRKVQSEKPENTRQKNITRIKHRKQNIYQLKRLQKLCKIASYSACQASFCNCKGWRLPEGN